jgi:hypothetical protein
MTSIQTTENLAYHAARVLILIRFCGKPRQKSPNILPGIQGRTLLAKLDFFLRYPGYLKRAAKILKEDLSDEELGLFPDFEINNVESRMIRYLYGPWDNIYYTTLAYLVGKGKGVEIFRITQVGYEIADQLADNSEYKDLTRRADTMYHLFNRYSGSRLKDFIYAYFPEVVNRGLGETI